MHVCGDCGFEAASKAGLTIHISRIHRTERNKALAKKKAGPGVKIFSAMDPAPAEEIPDDLDIMLKEEVDPPPPPTYRITSKSHVEEVVRGYLGRRDPEEDLITYKGRSITRRDHRAIKDAQKAQMEGYQDWLRKIGQPRFWTVYRMYDAEDRLLYVGMTWNLDMRLQAHWKDKDWIRDVARIQTEGHDNPSSAGEAEKNQIEELHPVYNRMNKAWRKGLRVRVVSNARSIGTGRQFAKKGDEGVVVSDRRNSVRVQFPHIKEPQAFGRFNLRKLED